MMKLIPEAKKWYRMFSIWALASIGFIQGVLAVMTESQLNSPIPFATTFTWQALATSATIAAAVLGGIGRLIDQGSATLPTEPHGETK